MKTTLVLGANGQDGSYLCDLLVEKGYDVHAAVRRSSTDTLRRIAHLLPVLHLHRFDLADGGSISTLLYDVSPTEVYNCADQDHVGTSWETPDYSLDVTAGGALRVLDAVRYYDQSAKPVWTGDSSTCHKPQQTRIYQPASATMFGNAPAPQNETSPVDPQSPYAVAKLAAFRLCGLYRRKYGLFISTAILFQHSSPRQGPSYLLGDVVRGVLDLKHGRAGKIRVRNLSAYVDVGFAGDFMQGVYRMMQLDEPGDYVIATGEMWLVADVVAEVLIEVFGNANRMVDVVETAPSGDSPRLMGDYGKLKRATGWVPTTSMRTLLQGIVKEIGKEYVG